MGTLERAVTIISPFRTLIRFPLLQVPAKFFSGAEMQCFECCVELDDALILVCDHNLCLSCAAKKSAGNGVIRCKQCGSQTNLEASSAQQLKEMFPQHSSATASFVSPPTRPLSLLSRPPLAHIPVQIPSPTMSSRSLSAPLPPPVSLMMPIQNRGSTGPMCGQCEASCADLRCLQCEELLCFDCSESLHRRGRMSSHQTVPIHTPTAPCPIPQVNQTANSPLSRSSIGDRSLITSRSVSCQAHRDEVVQYFCLQCESRPMCSECVFRSGEHTSHLDEVVLIKKAFPKIRSRINELVVEFEKSIKEIKINEINLSENKKSIENVHLSCKGQVNKLFNELRESLRVKELELVRHIEQMVERESKQLGHEMNRNAAKRSKIESVSRLLNSVREAQNSSESMGFEKEIEVLEAFSEMKISVSESRAEALKTDDLNLVQLFIPPDQVAQMSLQIDTVKQAISELSGIVPSRTAPTPVATSSSVSSREGSTSGRRRRGSASTKVSIQGATSSDRILMTAIEDAMRSST